MCNTFLYPSEVINSILDSSKIILNNSEEGFYKFDQLFTTQFVCFLSYVLIILLFF